MGEARHHRDMERRRTELAEVRSDLRWMKVLGTAMAVAPVLVVTARVEPAGTVTGN